MSFSRTSSTLEESLGMRYYATARQGIGGILRQVPDDFTVEEIVPEGKIANLSLDKLDRGEGNYTLMVMRKVSRDLLPTVSMLGKLLGADVSFAGIKDRRAITYQLLSANRLLAEGDLPKNLHNIDLKIVGRSRWPVEPGDLRGNRFAITIRAVDADAFTPELVAPLEWVPNFFGHQRFGTARPNTHKVGRLLIKKDYEGAVRELIAEPYEGEPDSARQARSDLKATWDLEKALSSFPTGLAYERHVIERLLQSPGDYTGALTALPVALIRLFIDSYQSFLFNTALSAKMEKSDILTLEPGDFASPLDKWGSPSRPIKALPGVAEKLRRMVDAKKAVPMMRVVGYKTDFTGGEGEIYGDMLDREGVTIGDFREVLGMPFEGTLRAVFFMPIAYEALESSPDELNPGKLKASITTSLPKSCYATVLLREIMRPTDPAAAGF